MGNVFSNLFNKKMPKKQAKILILGLDGAGKTTILYSLRLGEVIKTIPTIGFNVQQLNYKMINMIVWDVGGQQKLRQLWSHYFDKCKGLIYVVDSSDSQRIQLASSQLQRILEHPDMSDCCLLVLANKRDQATMNLAMMCQQLKLNDLKRNWAIFPIVAIKEKQTGLQQAMQWLINNIDFVKGQQINIKIR